MAKNYRGAKFNPSNYNGESTSNNLNPSSSYGFDVSKYNIPDVPKTNEIKSKSDLDLFREKMNKERVNTPSFIKGLYNSVIDPVAYAIDKTIYGNPLTQRTMVKAGETFTGPGGMKEYDGTTLEAKNAGKVGNFVADSTGTLLGMKALPVGNSNLLNATDKAGLKASEFASKKLPTTLNPTLSEVLPSMARGAVDNGLGSMALDAINGEDVGTTLKNTGANALGGALLFGTGKAIGEGLSNLKGFKKTPIELPNTKPTIEPIKPITSNIEQITPINPLPKIEDNALIAKDEVAAIRQDELPKIQSMINDKANLNEVAVGGEVTGPQKGVSQFKTNTMRNAPMLATEEAQKVIDDIHATYNVKPNEQSLNRAMADLETNPSEVIERIKSSSQLTGAEDTVAAGIITKQLRETAEKTGDYSELKSWLEEIQPKVTETAQSLQALSTWKKLTPEGALMKAQQVVGRVQRGLKETDPKIIDNADGLAKDLKGLFGDSKLTDAEKLKRLEEIFRSRKAPVKRTELERILEIIKLGGFTDAKFKDLAYEKFGIPTLTNDDVKFITDTLNKLGDIPEGRAKEIEFAKVKQLIADKIPPSLASKISSLQRISLLLNSKTMTRNILGNVIMGTLENTKDIPGAIIDKAVSGKFNGERTTLMPSLTGFKTQLKGGAKGFKETLEDYKLGINTSPASGQFDLPDTKTFRKGALGKLEGVTNLGLTLGDRPFWQGAYDETLRQQMKIKGVAEPTEEMINIAKDVANERTFQNVTMLMDSFKGLQKSLNGVGSKFGIGTKEFGLGNFIMPFTKTPANILDKAIDYSPIGGASGLIKLFSGKGTQKEIVDQLARSLNGTSLIGAGYLLAKNGMLTGQPNKDSDVASLEKQVGKTPYSIKVGDKYTTIDWAQPASIPLMIGADIFHQGKNQKEMNSVILDAIKSGGSTLFNQSLLQGMSKLFGGFGSSGGQNLVEGLMNTAMEIPGQFVPSALKQGAQLVDNNVRDTSSPSKFGNELNKMKAKVPILSTTLPSKVDTMGKEVKQFGGSQGLKYAFDVLFNPGYNNTYKPTEAEKFILDLYEKSGQTSQFPRLAKGNIEYTASKGKKEIINLTNEEKMDLQKYIGKQTDARFYSIINTPEFKSKTYENQAKELQNALTDIYNSGKTYILSKKGIKEYKGR